MEPLMLVVVPGFLGGLVIALFLARLQGRRPPEAAPDAFSKEPLSTDVINMARIRVAGVGGLGLVAMALVVAWAVPRIGQSLAIGVVTGAVVGAVLIVFRARRRGPMPSSGERPGANTTLSIDTPAATRNDRTRGGTLMRDAIVTFAVMLLVFGAFDDITTDNATSFRFEYTILIFCATWLTVLALKLLRDGHRIIGGVSLVALAAGILGQREIGPGIVPGLWPAYVATTAAFLWFVLLAVVLLALGVRAVSQPPASRTRMA